MKIELVKEIKIDNNILYSIEIDGRYVTNTATSDYDRACGFYDMLIQSNGNSIESKEILKSTELITLNKES